MTTGERIRLARQNAKLTQKQVSERSGIAEPTIRKYESNRLNPKFGTLEKLADAIECDVYLLLLEEIRPMTAEEIRNARGEPAWCPEIEAWGIITMDLRGMWANVPFLRGYRLESKEAACGCDFEYNIEKRRLTLYRHKVTTGWGNTDA